MKNGKAPRGDGIDGIPAVVLKNSSGHLKKELHTLICKMWQERKTPAGFKVANTL